MKGKDMKGRKPVPKGKIINSGRIVFNPTNRAIIDEYTESGHCIRTGKYAHHCYDWDEMLIDETDEHEFSICRCGVPDAKT